MATLTFMSGGKNTVVPVLDANSRISADNTLNRSWQNVFASRTRDTYYENTSGAEMKALVQSGVGAGIGYMSITLRNNSNNNEWVFRGQEPHSSTSTVINLEVTIPAGWSYKVNSNSMNTRTVAIWREFK